MIVRIIGAGLLGASAGLALMARGTEVQLEDASPHAAGLAEDLGAGRVAQKNDPDPDLVIVATPPDVVADCVNDALRRFPAATVTDVASVKAIIQSEIDPESAERYVGSHPMAGRERSGAVSADADLFVGRPWVIVGSHCTPEALSMIKLLAIDVGAIPIEMGAEAHDEAVARVSHVPQLLSSLMAARLVDTDATSLSLSGQGLRDVTRLAVSDPTLWSSIISGNSSRVAQVLREVQADLSTLIDSVDQIDARAGSYAGVAGVASIVSAGNTGVSRIPGKHGGAPVRYGFVTVLVPDKPGELGRLFTEVGSIGINIEDLSLEHSAGAQVGRARLAIVPSRIGELIDGLESRGWVIAETDVGE